MGTPQIDTDDKKISVGRVRHAFREMLRCESVVVKANWLAAARNKELQLRMI